MGLHVWQCACGSVWQEGSLCGMPGAVASEQEAAPDLDATLGSGSACLRACRPGEPVRNSPGVPDRRISSAGDLG